MLFNIIEQKVSANLLSILTLATSCQTYRSCFPLFDIDDLEMGNCSGGKVWDACGCCRVCAKLCNEKCGGPWNIHGLCDKGLTCIKSLKHGALPFNADGVCKKKTPKKCSLPKVTGPCRAFLRRWYFNTKKGQCEMFVYGGCKGNKNNFKTKKECENACDNECATKAKPKPCPQFCPLNYDPVCGTDGKTEKTYGNTCQLNVAICTTKGKYRFKSKGPCKSKPVTGGGDTCSLPKVTGPCRAYFRRWYFNKKTGRCERFIYGGCRGNKNNFKTKEECQETCGKSAKVCHLLKVSGPCKAYFPRWYYNTESQQCERFIYGGCKGNGNNFKTKRECEDRCTEWCDERRDHHHWHFNRHCERYASRFCTKDCKRCCVHKNDCNPDPRKYVYDFDCGFYDKEPYPQILDSEEYK